VESKAERKAESKVESKAASKAESKEKSKMETDTRTEMVEDIWALKNSDKDNMKDQRSSLTRIPNHMSSPKTWMELLSLTITLWLMAKKST